MAATERRHKPHVVFIVLDTQRVDRLGCYGYGRGTSPHLDHFAAGSTLFEQAISPAQWTIPTHASLFTGEFASTHLTLQADDALDPSFPTLAEWLSRDGYRATGFCNNPLVGVLENGFRRGFHAFYNYGGTVQSPWIAESDLLRSPLVRWQQWALRIVRRLTAKIENVFTRPNLLFRLAMNPALVPLWSRHSRFKGDTPASLGDTVRFAKKALRAGAARPHFLFVNVMQTHLPFAPRQRFIDRFAPIVNERPEAVSFMRSYNISALRWMLPLEHPFSELQAQTLSDMYDAEVAYQDDLLADLFAVLDQPEVRDDTLVIIVSDHGEMLGEHDLMGHGLGIYQELAHVPMLIRYPGQVQGLRISERVSTTHLFHTVLDVVGAPLDGQERVSGDEVQLLTLRGAGEPLLADAPVVCSEACPAETLLQLMRSYAPALLEPLQARQPVRAAYRAQHKLIRVEGNGEQLFDLQADPRERQPLSGPFAEAIARDLGGELTAFVEQAGARRPDRWTRAPADLSDDAVVERLRGLGYIE